MKTKFKPERIEGWLLICPTDARDDWYIAWCDVFDYKKDAIEFAEKNNWPKPYRAVRGFLAVA